MVGTEVLVFCFLSCTENVHYNFLSPSPYLLLVEGFWIFSPWVFLSNVSLDRMRLFAIVMGLVSFGFGWIFRLARKVTKDNLRRFFVLKIKRKTQQEAVREIFYNEYKNLSMK